jgi:two-component system, chemotaxis family, CheB/CheR fusion protein
MAAKPPSIRSEGHESRRVLVVDDNRDLVRTTSLLLKSQGFEVATAHDGRAAIEKARSFRPDVVLLDIGLPILDGYQVAERLRGDARTKAAMIIAISAYDRDFNATGSQEAAFDHHLVKPVYFDALLALFSRGGEHSE